MLQQNSSEVLKNVQLICKYQKNAKMLCCEENCDKYGCVCRNQDCLCLTDDHQQCEFVYADGLINQINKKRVRLNAQIEKAVEEMDKIYVNAIEKLSTDRQGLHLWKVNYGLTANEVKLLDMISQNKIDEIRGNLIHKIKGSINAPSKYDWLNEKWVSDFWKEQGKNFKRIFSKLSKCFKQFLVDTTITKYPVLESLITDENKMITEFIGKPIQQFKLLYRASQQKFSTAKFHEKCDLIPNTLLILQTQYGKIIGAFTPLLWRKMSGRQILPDDNLATFLFSVTMGQKYPLVNPATAIENYETVGPRFGGTDNLHGDLQIVDQANEKEGSYFNFPTSFNSGDKQKTPKTTNNFCGKDNGTGLTIKQWEVFQVIFD